MEKTILIVEDDSNIRELLSLYLEQEGYHIEMAQDGADGLRTFKRVHPDLVLLDLMMPVMDGTQMIRELRTFSKTPVIILTAKGEVFDKVTLPELSESDYDEAIMKALDHSRHFLVIITDLAQLDTYWIKLEMKTFHHEIVEGRKENSNFIMLVTDRVYQEIVSSNKTVLPLRYRSCEIMRISDYKAALPGYMTK